MGLELICFVDFQDNVFVTVVASIQYRAIADKAGDAFYKLSNTRAQIQAYVFDGTNLKTIMMLTFIEQMNLCFIMYIIMWSGFALSICLVIRGTVPKLNLDAAFEQKNDIAKAVEDELEKVMYFDNFYIHLLIWKAYLLVKLAYRPCPLMGMRLCKRWLLI